MFMIRIKEKFHELCENLNGKAKGETHIRGPLSKFSGGKTDYSRAKLMKTWLKDKWEQG